MALVLKICGSRWENASRDKRELSVYRDLGYEVVVLAKGETIDRGRIDNVDGFKVFRYTTRPFANKMPNIINRVAALFYWAGFVRIIKPDIITGHDLLGLTIGWMSTLFKANKPKLIYDSHEFEIGRNVKRSKMASYLIKQWEKYLMNKCAFSIVVNESIAEEVQRIHRLKEKPVVVRSTPSYCKIDESVCANIRSKMLDDYRSQRCLENGSNNNDICKSPYIVMYHGVLTSGRGIETLLHLLSVTSDTYGIILGNGSDNYKQSLLDTANKYHIRNRVLFYPAVPAEQLWKYVGAADLSLVMIQNSSKSYYYALPNKFFESIQALTPIVASDFPEMRRLIKKYNIGLTCDPEDFEGIAKAVEKIRNDNDLYQLFKKNIMTAKEELCWEKEKNVLIVAFKEHIINSES